MRILLLGEFSNLHATLCRALRAAGHEVLLVSDGDKWKNYYRDKDVSRRDGKLGSLALRWKLIKLLPSLRNFDVVNFINPQWVDMSQPDLLRVFTYLRRHNHKISLGLYGDDYYVMKGQNEGLLDYSDTNCWGSPVNVEANRERQLKWSRYFREITEQMVEKADFLIANLYEYYTIYDRLGFGSKLHYIASPIEIDPDAKPKPFDGYVNILVGMQKARVAVKGIDNMMPLLERTIRENPYKIKLHKVENVPFAEYQQLLSTCDVLVDQLYSYTPAMNALEAMKLGTVVISGGEEDYYKFIGEESLRPIINLRPFKNLDNLEILKDTLTYPAKLRDLSRQSIEFVRKYHDARDIAKEYLKIWFR